MFSLNSSHHYFLYQGYCDMRKSFDGLCGVVVSELKRNATSGEVFIFLNRPRTHIKLLHWEHGGFVLYYKRLEQGTFLKPSKGQLSWAELVLMIEGIQVQKSRQLRRYQI
jgi:transposase